MKLSYIIGLLAVLVLLTAQGCQQEAPATTPETQPETTPETEPVEVVEEPAAATGADVQILSNGFDPETVTIAVGGTVTWKNMDDTAHLLTVGTDRSPRLEGKSGATEDEEAKDGDMWETSFDQAGTYKVFDIISKATGTVIVE